MRKKLFLLLIVSLLLSVNYITFAFKASGKVTSEIRTVSLFHSVRLNCNGVVTIKNGSPQSVTINADDNIFSNIKTEVKGGELNITLSGLISDITKLEVDIVMDNINSLTVNGPGRIDVATEINNKNINLTVFGNGEMTLLINTDIIVSKIIGSGKISVEGKSLSHEVDINGSGQVNAVNLAVDKSKAKISNGGTYKSNVKEEIDLSINSGGNLEYMGSPKIKAKVTGSGNITYKEAT